MSSSLALMVKNPADALFQEYAECADPQRAEELLETLIVTHAQPGIRKIVRFKLAFPGRSESQDVDDVSSDVVVELLTRLRAMKAGEGAPAIADFSAYTAVSAYHACNEYVRRKYPNRHRLKTRLRYLLGTEKNFAIWGGDNGGWLCGLAAWVAEQRRPATPEAVTHWRDRLGDAPRGRQGQHPASVVTLVFERIGAPIDLDDLVGIMAELQGIEDAPPAPEKAARELEAAEFDPAERLDLKRWLAELWSQIKELPVAQRVALLLNLQTSTDRAAVTLLPLTGVAGIREIAETLDMPPLELAELWNRLPLDDLTIGERLGAPRQRVINLRKSARERLMRRMGKHLIFGGGQ